MGAECNQFFICYNCIRSNQYYFCAINCIICNDIIICISFRITYRNSIIISTNQYRFIHGFVCRWSHWFITWYKFVGKQCSKCIICHNSQCCYKYYVYPKYILICYNRQRGNQYNVYTFNCIICYNSIVCISFWFTYWCNIKFNSITLWNCIQFCSNQYWFVYWFIYRTSYKFIIIWCWILGNKQLGAILIGSSNCILCTSSYSSSTCRYCIKFRPS